MMIMVRVTETTGVYTWLAIRAGQLSGGRPLAIVLALSVTTAVLSAFLDNVTTILLIVPITFLLADALDVDPVPLIIIEIIASNIGGTATLIGDPPNILIAGHTGLSFGAFIVNLAPVVVVALVLVIPALYVVFRKRLQIAPAARKRVLALDASQSIEDPAEARRTVPILVLTILVFFIHKPLHLEPATVALAGAAVILLVSRQPLHGSVSSIEWLTLFFLIGLFVMVGALEHTGALGEVADAIASLTGGDRTAELLGILWVSAIGSALVDNIPFTAAMIPVVDSLATDDGYWWALALGATALALFERLVERATQEGGTLELIEIAREQRAHELALAEDPGEAPVTIDDRQGRKAALEEAADRYDEAIVAVERLRFT
jgi:Na+/H+ antiporter NhaD/arsenite permease-like protein